MARIVSKTNRKVPAAFVSSSYQTSISNQLKPFNLRINFKPLKKQKQVNTSPWKIIDGHFCSNGSSCCVVN